MSTQSAKTSQTPTPGTNGVATSSSKPKRRTAEEISNLAEAEKRSLNASEMEEIDMIIAGETLQRALAARNQTHSKTQ